MRTIVNMTPHTINVFNDNGEEVGVFEPSGDVTRVSVETVHHIGILFRQYYGAVEGLPVEDEDTFLLVSNMVRQAMPGRVDLVSPGQLIRDDSGRPVGCRGLVINY